MLIRFVNSSQQPLTDAVVTVARAPGQTHDIGMLTDADGYVSVEVSQPGTYEFEVHHAQAARRASAHLTPQQESATLVVV